MQEMKVVMVGNGMVGQRFLEQLVARGRDFDITAFCEEPRPAYDRVRGVFRAGCRYRAASVRR